MSLELKHVYIGLTTLHMMLSHQQVFSRDCVHRYRLIYITCVLVKYLISCLVYVWW